MDESGNYVAGQAQTQLIVDTKGSSDQWKFLVQYHRILWTMVDPFQSMLQVDKV